MALTRVSGRVVYPHGEDTPTPVTGDGVIEYVHATPGVIGEAVHGPDRHRIEYVDGVAGEAWLKAGMWRAYVYPSEGRSYTLHLGIPEDGDVTLADVVGEVVPEGIVTRGEQGLKGDTGPASTVPGPAGPPGQALTPESMLVVGPGRPDAPTTTGMTSEALAALPVGCEYRSTDGAAVGAWTWQKTGPSAWMVTASDAPARRIDFVDGTVVTIHTSGGHTTIKRVGTDVAFSVSNITASGTISAWQKDIPSGFRPSIEVNAPLICGEAAGTMRLLVQSSGRARISGTVTHALINGLVTWKTSDPWPTTLPGTPA